MIRYYLAPLVTLDVRGGITRRGAAFFWNSGIPVSAEFDDETGRQLIAADMDEAQHAQAMAADGMVYVGPAGGAVSDRAGIIAAGYPVDPGEPVDQLVGELKNLIWIAKRRHVYHTALRAFGLDPATRPTKAQETTAARAGMRTRPPLNEFPIVKAARAR